MNSKISEIAILYLSKNFRKKIKLDDVAKTVGLSSFHFHRKFVEENNCSPFEYLENIRMQNASHLMGLFPDGSLTDVAFECGYSSPGIFSRAFKNYFGVSPSKYKPEVVAVPNDSELKNSKPVRIQYMAKKTLEVTKVTLSKKDLNRAYGNLIDTTDSSLVMYGVFLDAPFHLPPLECRYFIGKETSKTKNDESLLTIPSGYYTTLVTRGDFDHLKNKIVALNHQIQQKGYVIDSLIGHEKIVPLKTKEPFNYMKMDRELFVKIKRE